MRGPRACLILTALAAGCGGSDPQTSPRDGGTDRADTSADRTGTGGTGGGSVLLAIDPSSSSFSAQAGGSSDAVTFDVDNYGTGRTNTLTVTVEGDDPDDFVLQNDTCTGRTLEGGWRCTVSVVFAPGSSGPKSAILRAAAAPASPTTATLTGNALAQAQVSITPAPAALGDVAVGATASRSFVVRNDGDVATGALAVSLEGPDAAAFTVGTTGNGCSGTALGARQTCTFSVVFAPTSVGPKSASLRVAGDPGGATSSELSGSASQRLAASPSPVAFDPVLVGESSGGRVVTISNTGSTSTGTLATVVEGAGASAFALSSNTCAGRALAAAATCTVTVTFAPSARGAQTASLRVSGGDAGRVDVPLSGSGITSAALTVAPTAHTFPTRRLDDAPQTVEIRVSNAGDLPTGVLATALEGASVAELSLLSDACAGQQLAGGATCRVVVQLAPTTSGAKTATFSASASPGGAVSVSLTGTAVRAATLVLSPADKTFGAVLVSEPSAEESFTVTNAGDLATGQITVGVSGADFAITGDTCTGQDLAKDGTCEVRVRFTPTATGDRAGSLIVSARAAVTATAALSGTGL